MLLLSKRREDLLFSPSIHDLVTLGHKREYQKALVMISDYEASL